MDQPLPKDIDFNDNVYTLIKHKDWILNWNRDFFSNLKNNINEYIEKLEHEQKKFIDTNSYNLISIYDFRLHILNTIKEEMKNNKLPKN
jgi:hypothetical protein